MDKETLSQYGWVVIVIIVLAILIGLASPFGNFVSESVMNTADSFGQKVITSLDAAGVVVPDNEIAEESLAITEMQPMAFNLPQNFVPQATAAKTPNYIYAKQMWAMSVEDAIETKEGYTYEGEPSSYGCYGTGSTIRIYKDGELFGTYLLVVIGDVNGDGGVDVLDAAKIAVVKFTQNGLTGAELAAADLNRNGILEEGSEGTTKADYDAVTDLAVDEDLYIDYYNAIVA